MGILFGVENNNHWVFCFAKWNINISNGSLPPGGGIGFVQSSAAAPRRETETAAQRTALQRIDPKILKLSINSSRPIQIQHLRRSIHRQFYFAKNKNQPIGKVANFFLQEMEKDDAISSQLSIPW